MIDNEKIREAVSFIKNENNFYKLVGHFNFRTADAIRNIFALAELYLAGKLVEPASQEEIEKIINQLKNLSTLIGVRYDIGIPEHLAREAVNVTIPNVIKALVGKIGKKGVKNERKSIVEEGKI